MYGIMYSVPPAALPTQPHFPRPESTLADLARGPERGEYVIVLWATGPIRKWSKRVTLLPRAMYDLLLESKNGY